MVNRYHAAGGSAPAGTVEIPWSSYFGSFGGGVYGTATPGEYTQLDEIVFFLDLENVAEDPDLQSYPRECLNSALVRAPNWCYGSAYGDRGTGCDIPIPLGGQCEIPSPP